LDFLDFLVKYLFLYMEMVISFNLKLESIPIDGMEFQ